ncbi:hypothetical protein [Streptomyces sp. NPDC004266]|uniref:hypothetical protein n=1 Tax=Streptomyces sp. NPDC004266 TaxID=3364693 RepID=UPI0036CCA27F
MTQRVVFIGAADEMRRPATVRRLDLYGRENLPEVISGAAPVVLDAGPSVRTSEPVIEACLEARVPHLGFDAASELDTVEDIELGRLFGDERPDVGRAVLERVGTPARRSSRRSDERRSVSRGHPAARRTSRGRR